MTKWELVAQLDKLTDEAAKAGLSKQEILSALKNTMGAVDRWKLPLGMRWGRG